MRHVIQHSNGLFYTEMTQRGEREVQFNGQTLREPLYGPVFEGIRADQGSKFNTKKDAEDLMAHASFGGPDSFAGCTVVSYSTDTSE